MITKMNRKLNKLTSAIMTKIATKKNGDETLIVKIMLMVVAVVLCILFRDTLSAISSGLLANVENWITSMYQ